VRRSAAIAQDIEDRGAVFAVADSVGLARGGAPESAEETIQLFAALRTLTVPVQAVDHKTKAAIESKEDGVFGSVYTHNSARRVWEFKKAQAEGSPTIALLFKNTKANNGPKAAPLGYRIEFTNTDAGQLEVIRFTDQQPDLMEELTEWLTVAARIRLALKSVPSLTVAEIGELVDVSDATLRQTLHRHPQLFIKLPGTAKPAKWTLNIDDWTQET
jgi:hypothetical protein